MGNTDKILTVEEVSEITGLAVVTLNGYRRDGIGPPYIKYRKSVRYNESDVREWVEKQKVNTSNGVSDNERK